MNSSCNVHGLPLVALEFKSAIREEATIHDAYVQLTVRYKRDIPELFKYNAFCVISDGVNNKAGSFFAPYDFFYAWRSVPDGQLLDKDRIDSMFTLVKGMLNKRSLRDIIHNFIYLPDSSKKDEKSYVAIHNIMRPISFLITSNCTCDRKVMVKEVPTLGLLAVAKAIPCYSLPGC